MSKNEKASWVKAYNWIKTIRMDKCLSYKS